jgi:hypothetical protein
MPNARNAYSVGNTPLRSPLELFPSRHAIVPAARPHRDEIVRAPGATSSRVPHFGHSTLSECAATSGAGISVLQCGQTRAATGHLPFPTLGSEPSGPEGQQYMKLLPNAKKAGRSRIWSRRRLEVAQALLPVRNLQKPHRQECLCDFKRTLYHHDSCKSCITSS